MSNVTLKNIVELLNKQKKSAISLVSMTVKMIFQHTLFALKY